MLRKPLSSLAKATSVYLQIPHSSLCSVSTTKQGASSREFLVDMSQEEENNSRKKEDKKYIELGK